MKKIILASSSPRRRDLMNLLCVEFEVIASDFDEKLDNPKNPKETVESLAHGKAKAVANKFEHAIIIGADTVVVHKGEILGKPKSQEDAKRMLNLLSGTEHSIITGLSVIDTDTGQTSVQSVESKVKFKNLSDNEINAYIATGEPMDKAGSYAVQERGGLFVEKITGDYFNIVGLPLKDLRAELSKFGVKILE